MKNRSKNFWLGMLAITLAFTMAIVGCDNGTTTGGDGSGGGGQELPAASGANAVSGRTYYVSGEKTVFSATTTGTANGTYTVGITVTDDDGDPVLEDGKYKYADIETGTYTWNDEDQTVTLKPQKVNGNKTEAALRLEIQAYYNTMRQIMGETEFNQYLSSLGYSSLTAFVNSEVNKAFSNKTKAYSFSGDETALFLEDILPANKGTNELSGETYYELSWYLEWDDDAEEDILKENEDTKYVFDASCYTISSYDGSDYTEIETGSYAYDSSLKRVWLKPSTKDGKTRAEYYDEESAPSDHYFADDDAYRAAETNDRFRLWEQPYNSANKRIGSED